MLNVTAFICRVISVWIHTPTSVDWFRVDLLVLQGSLLINLLFCGPPTYIS